MNCSIVVTFTGHVYLRLWQQSKEVCLCSFKKIQISKGHQVYQSIDDEKVFVERVFVLQFAQ
jgi:hypothetical protein